jgi:hypothetical protein
VQLAGHLLYIVLNALVVLWLTSRQQLYRLFTFSKPLHTLTVRVAQQPAAGFACHGALPDHTALLQHL